MLPMRVEREALHDVILYLWDILLFLKAYFPEFFHSGSLIEHLMNFPHP